MNRVWILLASVGLLVPQDVRAQDQTRIGRNRGGLNQSALSSSRQAMLASHSIPGFTAARVTGGAIGAALGYMGGLGVNKFIQVSSRSDAFRHFMEKAAVEFAFMITGALFGAWAGQEFVKEFYPGVRHVGAAGMIFGMTKRLQSSANAKGSPQE